MISKYIILINSYWHHILRNPKDPKTKPWNSYLLTPLEDEFNEKYDELKNLIAS
jgi:hypothetical protein